MAIDSDAYLDEDNSAGKFFQIEVPAYVVTSGEGPNSYLRLGVPNPAEAVVEIPGEGSAAADTHADLGTDLALKAWIKGLDVKGKSADTEDGPYTLFEDDERDRGPHTHLSKEDRKSATDAFFQKLGWRDHTDGNRLTTTRGDKVEVIRGNYKLVVLGRQDTPGEAAGFDISGGDTRALGCVDAEVDTTEVTWDHADDCWCVTEKVHSGKRFEYFTGTEKHEETKVSKALTEIVIASNIASTVNAVTITETTTAVNIAESVQTTGLESQETIALAKIENINAGSITSMVNVAVSMAENVNVVGLKQENVNAGMINAQTNVLGAISEQVNAGMINEQTNVPVGAITESTNAAMITSLTTAGLIAEATVVTAAAVDVFAGPVKIDVTAAAALDIFLGAKLDLAIGAILEISLAEKLVLGIEEHHLRGDIDISAKEYTIDATGDFMLTAGGTVIIGQLAASEDHYDWLMG